MVGRTRVWLAVGVVAALVCVVLWRGVPAAQRDVPGANVEAAPSPDPANTRANGTVTRPSQGRPAEAAMVRVFEDLKRRAQAGDAVAQRELAEVYDACFIVNLDRSRFLEGIDHGRRSLNDPAQRELLERVARERLAQCDAVDGGAIVPSELIRGWYAQAAENGDLAARLMDNAFKQKKLDAAGSARLLEEVLGSNDPAAVFAMGNTLGPDYPISPDDPAAPLMTGELAGTAWMAAACRMGYRCEVNKETLCLMISHCPVEDFETEAKKWLRTEAERREFERRVAEILRLVEGQ